MIRHSITGRSARHLVGDEEIAHLRKRLSGESRSASVSHESLAGEHTPDEWLDSGRRALREVAHPFVWHFIFVCCLAARQHSVTFLRNSQVLRDIFLASMGTAVCEMSLSVTGLAVCIMHLPLCARAVPLLVQRTLSFATALATGLSPVMAATQSAGSRVWIVGLSAAVAMRIALCFHSEGRRPLGHDIDPRLQYAALITLTEVAGLFFIGVAIADRMLRDADWSTPDQDERASQNEEKMHSHFVRLLVRRSKLRALQKQAASEWRICRGCGEDHWADKGFVIDHINHPNSPIRGLPSPLRTPLPGSLHSHFGCTLTAPPSMAPSSSKVPKIRVYKSRPDEHPDERLDTVQDCQEDAGAPEGQGGVSGAGGVSRAAGADHEPGSAVLMSKTGHRDDAGDALQAAASAQTSAAFAQPHPEGRVYGSVNLSNEPRQQGTVKAEERAGVEVPRDIKSVPGDCDGESVFEKLAIVAPRDLLRAAAPPSQMQIGFESQQQETGKDGEGACVEASHDIESEEDDSGSSFEKLARVVPRGLVRAAASPRQMQAPVDEALLQSELKHDDEPRSRESCMHDDELVGAIETAARGLQYDESGALHAAVVNSPSACVPLACEVANEKCSRRQELQHAAGAYESLEIRGLAENLAECDEEENGALVDGREDGALGGEFVVVPYLEVAEETMAPPPVPGSCDEVSDGREPTRTVRVEEVAEGTGPTALHGAGAWHLAAASAGGAGDEDAYTSGSGWVSLDAPQAASAQFTAALPWAQQMRADSPRISNGSFKRAKDIQVSLVL